MNLHNLQTGGRTPLSFDQKRKNSHQSTRIATQYFNMKLVMTSFPNTEEITISQCGDENGNMMSSGFDDVISCGDVIKWPRRNVQRGTYVWADPHFSWLYERVSFPVLPRPILDSSGTQNS